MRCFPRRLETVDKRRARPEAGGGVEAGFTGAGRAADGRERAMGSDGTTRGSGERGRWITHRHGGRLIDPLGRGAPGGRGRADLLRLGRACLAEDQRARVTAESTRGTGTRADVGRSAVPGARTGRSDAMRGRHVAHSRHHLVSVVLPHSHRQQLLPH